MPLLDSFRVDHTIMPAPAVRVAKVMQTPKGDEIGRASCRERVCLYV